MGIGGCGLRDAQRDRAGSEAESVGIPCRFHDLRHSHVALLIEAGEDPKVIQERLGHASISVTYDTYGHLFPGRDALAAERLATLREQARVGHVWARDDSDGLELPGP